MASVCNLKILPATAGDAAGQAANIVVRPEDTAAANLVEEASCFRRATDSTESLDDTASAAVSSPWRQASLPFIFFETPYKFTHDDPQPRAAPKCFARAEETALGASLNAQSQAPDEIIWASFHAQDRQCSPHIFVDYFRFCRQEPARLLTTQDSLYLSLWQVSQGRAKELFQRHSTRPYKGVPRIESFVFFLWIPVVRQGVVCFLSGGLGFSWIFTAVVFYDPCGSSLFVSMYISLAFSLRRFA
jgi:hypothetical protein